MELDSCLMCTSQCESQNGPVKRERIETGDVAFTTADQYDDYPDSASDEEHLTPFFVLQNILKVPTETLEQLIYWEFNSQDPLSQGNGGAGGQVPLCPPCAELARQFHETFEEVSRLKIILSGIQAEFMDKLQRNKDDQCQGSSSSWKQLRRQLVLQCFGDDAPPKTEESGEFEEEWHFVETVVKSEVADEHDEDGIQCFGDDVAPNTEGSQDFEEEWHFGEPTIKTEVTDKPGDVKFMDKIQGSEDFEEEWHLGETIVKVEVADEPDDDDECKFAVSASPMSSNSSSALRFEPTPHLEVYEGIYEGPPKKRKASRPEVIPVLKNCSSGKKYWQQCTKCPFSTQTASLMDAHVPLHEEGSQAVACQDCGWYMAPEKLSRHRAALHHLPRGIQKIMRKAAQQQLAPEIQCTFCPHKTTDIVISKRHHKVHEAGSEATACNGCGIFFFSKGFVYHQNTCSRVVRNSLGGDKLLSEVETKGKMRNTNACNPGFISFNRGMQKKKHYQCRQCPYETLNFARVKVHVELHEEASQSVTCEECGWLLPPEQLEEHRSVNHSGDDLASGCTTTASEAKLKCGECSYQCKSKLKTLFETHVKGHRQGAGAASRCEDCGCHLSLRLLKGHRKYCLARRTQSCEESGASVGDTPARPYEPESDSNDDQDGVGEEDCG